MIPHFTRCTYSALSAFVGTVNLWWRTGYNEPIRKSLNFILKNLQKWKEAPVDGMVLVLHRLADMYNTEITRVLTGLGDYVLREGLTSQPLAGNALPSMSAANIIDSLRNATAIAVNTGDILVSQTPLSRSSTSSSIEPTCCTNADMQDVEPTTCDVDYSMATTYERAATVVANDKISLNGKLAVFTVLGTTEPRVVKLFPTTPCSCLSQSNCYHILAARVAVGCSEKPKIRQLNLTQNEQNE